jgi:nanoRNase/pAp phosphatase (c-di-AMP/oligoRNAs hydrolase)
LSRALSGAFVCRGVIGTHLGALSSPERVAQMADLLLTYERAHWAVVTGRCQDRLHVSLRTDDSRGGAGRVLKRILWGGNRGGGHAMVAGGTVQVGEDAPETKWRENEDRLVTAFLANQGLEGVPISHPFGIAPAEKPQAPELTEA